MKTSWSDIELINAVAESSYMAEVLRRLGLVVANGNYRTVSKRIMDLHLSKSHWLDRASLGKRYGNKNRQYVNKEILVENSPYVGQAALKRRLLKDGLFENKCAVCGQTEWQGKKLVMVLDHVNGEHTDNRIENLRMLCPNCNSQQDTFAGRNKKTVEDPRRVCVCGGIKQKTSRICRKCIDAERRDKYGRPEVDVIKQDVENLGWSATGKKYGVSGTSIRRWVNG
jgi:5-methylcytosine-specific restriction endonuclease McrA